MYQVAVYFLNNPSAPGKVYEFATQSEARAFEELMDNPDLLVVSIGYVETVEEAREAWYLDHQDLKYYGFEDYEPWDDHDGHVVAFLKHLDTTQHNAHVNEFLTHDIPF